MTSVVKDELVKRGFFAEAEAVTEDVESGEEEEEVDESKLRGILGGEVRDELRAFSDSRYLVSNPSPHIMLFANTATDGRLLGVDTDIDGTTGKGQVDEASSVERTPNHSCGADRSNPASLTGYDFIPRARTSAGQTAFHNFSPSGMRAFSEEVHPVSQSSAASLSGGSDARTSSSKSRPELAASAPGINSDGASSPAPFGVKALTDGATSFLSGMVTGAKEAKTAPSPPKERPTSPSSETQKLNADAKPKLEHLERPCEHNEWDDVRTRKGVKVLRCRICQAQLKLPSNRVPRCIPFLQEGRCEAKEKCDLLHVHKQKKGLVERHDAFGETVLKGVPSNTWNRAKQKPSRSASDAASSVPSPSSRLQHLRQEQRRLQLEYQSLSQKIMQLESDCGQAPSCPSCGGLLTSSPFCPFTGHPHTPGSPASRSPAATSDGATFPITTPIGTTPPVSPNSLYPHLA